MTEIQDMIRVAGASGFWGDAPHATAQLLTDGSPDYIVYDYLAEITMAILARARSRDARLGYATDFVTAAMTPNLPEIARQGVRIISNAGGVNPAACADKLRSEISALGLDLKVATVTGDNLMPQIEGLSNEGIREMFLGTPFPEIASVASANAYLGAFPIAQALGRGADIVITGRCVDSAVTLAATIHAFGWQRDDLDLLAAGSLAGHIIECGTHATGGNFTDWHEVAADLASIGYPMVEIGRNGDFTVTKPPATGGQVSFATVAEQLVYEIGDPQAYILADVICDFSAVSLQETGKNRVFVTGARGRAPTDSYKACATWQNGYRGGHLFGFYGIDAEKKATVFAKTALARASAALKTANALDFSETSVEILGSESQFGAARQVGPAREVNAKIAVRHPEAGGVALFLKEATGLGLSAPPGLSGFAGARPKPSPVMALFSFLMPKDRVRVTITDNDGNVETGAQSEFTARPAPARPTAPIIPVSEGGKCRVPVIRLAFARSGDKGDNANIGVIPRRPECLPWLWHGLDEPAIRTIFGHFLAGDIERYLLPGLPAMNIVLTQVLGGGGTSSLRADPQGKGFAQLVLAHEITVPKSLIGVSP